MQHKKIIVHHNTHNSGYILLLTILFIALIVIITTFIATRGSIFTPFMDTMIKREQATMLALAGVNIGLSMLALPIEQKKTQEPQNDNTLQKPPPSQAGPDEQAQLLFKKILPFINQPNIINLQQNRDGITGSITCILNCEQGKIDINAIYDFKKKIFRGEKELRGNWKTFLQELFKQIQTNMGGENLFPAFEKFLKARQVNINDVTELLTIPEFALFKRAVFWEPMDTNKKKQLYLTDIFTVHGETATLEPWLLSDSLRTILGLNDGNAEQLNNKETIEKTVKSFKRTAQWQEDWNIKLKPFYGKELQSLPKNIESMLSTTFDPTVFSVIVYGKIGAITQRLYAIIKRMRHVQKGKVVYDSTIKKLYWF